MSYSVVNDAASCSISMSDKAGSHLVYLSSLLCSSCLVTRPLQAKKNMEGEKLEWLGLNCCSIILLWSEWDNFKPKRKILMLYTMSIMKIQPTAENKANPMLFIVTFGLACFFCLFVFFSSFVVWLEKSAVGGCQDFKCKTL